MSYESYLPETADTHPYDGELSGYMDDALKGFICGDKDIGSDEEWEKYLNGLPR